MSNCQRLDKVDGQEPEMFREAAKKIVDLMIKHGAEQKMRSSPRYNLSVRMMNFEDIDE